MDDWEFRLSDDRRSFAFYDPGNGPWFIPEANMRGRFVETADMDRVPDVRWGGTVKWMRFLTQEQAAAEIMKIVKETVVEANDIGGVDLNDLVTRLAEAGYEFSEEEE